jgi:hypothetical protein
MATQLGLAPPDALEPFGPGAASARWRSDSLVDRFDHGRPDPRSQRDRSLPPNRYMNVERGPRREVERGPRRWLESWESQLPFRMIQGGFHELPEEGMLLGHIAAPDHDQVGEPEIHRHPASLTLRGSLRDGEQVEADAAFLMGARRLQPDRCPGDLPDPHRHLLVEGDDHQPERRRRLP